MKNTVKITIPQPLADKLKAKAKAEGVSVAVIVERAFKEYMTKRRDENGR